MSGRTEETSRDDNKVPVLVEMRVQYGITATFAIQLAAGMTMGGFQVDPDYEPVPIRATDDTQEILAAANEQSVVVRGFVEPDGVAELEAQPNVIKVWRDAPIAGFAKRRSGQEEATQPAQPTQLIPGFSIGMCPIAPCDTTFGRPANGTLVDVANYLGANQIWAEGYRGQGIVIGIVDGGITAIGRQPRAGETPKIPRVIGGWPTADWGTTASAWLDHGNMTATDALGMAPEAQIYDIRIGQALAQSTISSAIAGYEWAINQHKADGTPHILSNSWGMYQEDWAPDYANDPSHPFTRKVVEAIDEGILVLFSAGNCGITCPDNRCGSDQGPGRSIWGANGHPRVMTVGAANLSEQWVGYSSQGPAALDANKPDFCGITHFAGYFPVLNNTFASDTGTSAAAPIVAGVVALLKQAEPSLTQDEAKMALRNSAKNMGDPGWDPHSGAGIVQAYQAYQLITAPEPAPSPENAELEKRIAELEKQIHLLVLQILLSRLGKRTPQR